MGEFALASVFLFAVPAIDGPAAFYVSPPSVLLASPEASQQLLVTGLGSDGLRIDLTRDATFEVAEPRIVRVDSRGLVYPLAEGHTVLSARHGAQVVRVPV